MKAHEEYVDTKRQEWEDNNDPAMIKIRRELKRSLKQEQHAERMERQAEKAREWHAKQNSAEQL